MKKTIYSCSGKSLLLGLACCAATGTAMASHLTGGDLTVKHLTGNNYEIRLTQYRDSTSSNASFARSMTYTIRTANSAGEPNVVFRTDSVVRKPSLTRSILTNATFIFEAAVYLDTVQLPANKYWIGTTECCRNGSISNMSSPSSNGLGLIAEITVPATGTTSSPVLLAPPMPFYARNAVAVYNPLAYDPDGDSLVWTPITPFANDNWMSGTRLGTPVTGYTQAPTNATLPHRSGAGSGSFFWRPATSGMFTQAFRVEEYRNGLRTGSSLRDYSYVVLGTDTMGVPVLTPSSNVQFDPTDTCFYVTYTPGQALSFSVMATVGTIMSPLEINAYSELSQSANIPQFSVTNPSPSSATGVFNWTPAASFQRTVKLVLRGKNDYLQRDFTVMLKPNPNSNPVGVTTTAPALNARLYPNPASGRFQVELHLPAATQLKASVVNLLGQQVLELHNGPAQGFMTLTNQEVLPQGLYFVRLQTASGSTTVLPLTTQ